MQSVNQAVARECNALYKPKRFEELDKDEPPDAEWEYDVSIERRR